MYTGLLRQTLIPLTFLTILFISLTYSVSATDDKTKIIASSNLSDEQKGILERQASSFKKYQLASCEDEQAYYKSFLGAKKALSASMMPPPIEVTECCETAQQGDDAEEIIATGVFDNDDTLLGIGNTGAGGTSGPGYVGLRFDCYDIPQGATITSAYIQFTSAHSSVRGAAFTIYGEDADDCIPYDAANPISGRPLTSANVAWSPPTWVNVGDSGPSQLTPDLQTIVQEIVNRPGYTNGNALCFRISGKGHRRAYSFDSGLGAPELCVTYEVPEELTTCPDCPEVTMASLDGVPGFPTVDLLNVCSEPDTVSLLIYNTSECDLSNVQLTLNLDPGLTYGGCVMEHYGTGVPAGELDVSDPSNPVFLITQIDSAAAYIIDICIKADCDVDITSESPLNLDANLVFSYPNDSGMDEQCDLTLTEIGEYNGGIRIPVLNTLSITPQEISITNTTTEKCQTILVSQDGIQAQLSQYTLDICGLDFANYGLGTICANGTPIDPALITTDAATGTAQVVIQGSMFNGNTGASANGDDIFDVDERMTLKVCYTAVGCTEETMTPEYKIYYGCADKICFGVTSILGAVKFTPNFGASPVALTSDITYGSICGDDLSFTVDLSSANNDPLDGLWQDLILKYAGCSGNGMNVEDIIVGGVSLDPSLYSQNGAVIEMDFTANVNPAYGLSDEDGDGFMDDLPGDQNLIITTVISIGCSESMGACTGSLACSLTRMEVNGKRNCGQDFQQFANLSQPISFFYGNDGTSTNAVSTTGYGIPITEVMFTVCDTWLPAVEGHHFHYDFNSNNIGHCAMSGGIKLQAYVQANGDRIKHIRYEAGSATYQGNPVPGTTWQYDTVDIGGGILDTVGVIIEIPAGDPNVNAHDYFFNLEYEGECFTNDYHYTSFKVVEECLSCTEVMPCEIVRACDSHATYVDWNGCACQCDMLAYVDTLMRCNYGFADKEMTMPLTAADIPTEDLIRFLPGDTMYVRLGFEIYNSIVFYEGDSRWLFDVRYRHLDEPLIPDVYNVSFEGWFHEDISAGTGPLEIGIPDCMLDYDDANRDNTSYPSMRLENFGVEGGLGDGSECPDDDINPNYPAESVAAYRIVDMSGADYYNDLSRLTVYFGRDEGCASASPDELNTCHEDLLAQLDLEDGDFFYIDMKIPMVRNPNVSLAALNGRTPTQGYIYPYVMTYMNTPGTCSAGSNAMTCRQTGPYEGHLPGPVSITQDICVTDCDTEVEYSFNLQNPLPEVDAGILPWYENEYRPFMATDYLEMKFPSNMVYLNNGVLVMPDGSEVDFGPFIDTSTGNLNCLTGADGSVCCIADDPTQLAGMRIVDNDYTIGQSHTYYRGPISANNTGNHCDVYQLLHVPNDPFPHIPVGGPEVTCGYGLKYSLSALCPEDIESGDFQLQYQFSDPYVPSFPGSGGAYNSYHHNSTGNPYPYSHGFYYPINPYGTGCDTYPNATYPWDYGCQRFYENIVSNPDDSPGNINPMRQTGVLTPTPDNFADKSMNFPPLSASIQNTLIADEAMMNEVNTYMVCSIDNGVDLGTHENVVTTIQIPTTIQLIDICDETGTPITVELVSATSDYNLYSVVNPDLPVGECFEIQVKTELLFCPVGLANVDVEICLTTVSGCIEPDKAALFTALGETQCDAAGACYEYIAEAAELQAEWSCNAIGELQLCDTVEFGIRLKNVRPTLLVDVEPEFWFPAGLTFVPGSFEYIFPGGPGNFGTRVPIPDPTPDPSMNNIYGSYFEYTDDSIWAPPIDQDGFPGVASTLDSNKVEIKFDVTTNCNEFVSGTSIWFRGDAADPCEARVGTGFVPTFPIIIDGANPSDFAQFFVFADPLDATCGEASTITLNFLNISPTGVSNNSMACMDIETSTFMYMMGSVQWLSPAGHMPMFTETMNGAITHLCFDIPDGIGPGQAFQISFMFEVPEDVGCGEQDLGVNVSSTVMNSNCMTQGIVCDVQVLNSVNPSIQVDFNPPVEVSEQTLTVGCGNGDGTVPLCYDVCLANNGDDYNDDIKIKIIRDLNQNGILESFDPPLDSAIVNVSVLSGDTLCVQGCFDVLESIACPVFLMVMQETNCVCDAQDFYYDSIEPSASDDLGQSIAICPGAPLKIAYCGDLEYSVSPSAGATIVPNAAGDSLCITLAAGYGLTNPVVLNVTSQTGGCMEFNFDTEIYSLGDFVFENYEADTACNVGCIPLDLNLPTEYRNIVTVDWSPTTYLSDPTSQTPTACDVAMDITYTVTVNFMENGQMCEFVAEYPIVVVEQETNALFDQVVLCSDESSTVVGPPGFTNYNWYEVTPSGDLPIQSGTSDSFTIPSAGVYYLEYYSVGDACKTLSTPFDAIPCPAFVKSFVSAIPTANENEYTVCYEIAIDNNSALDTEYDLYDFPDFDDDITILSASYTSSVGPSGALAVPPPASPGWLLGNDVQLVGNGSHTFDICLVVVIDLDDAGASDSGDDTYSACGSSGGGNPIAGEGLFNEAGLDVNNDGTPDAVDDACGDLPHYLVEKTLTSLTQTGAYTWTVEYEIEVCNDGGGYGTYDLNDVPAFDDDITITGASFTTDAFDHPSNPGPTALSGSGPWDLADLQEIEPSECQLYTITVDVTMDLQDAATPGDGAYTACGDNGGAGPVPGEGLYNEAQLDTNGDGMPNQAADDCGDLPSITHEKNLTSITQTGPKSWEAKYTITVENNGGASGAYDLIDEIGFDDDVEVTCVRYTSDATGNPNNPGPTNDADLAGPWTLADDQNIDPGETQTFCIIFCVDMDLNDSTTPGDGDYDACGDGGQPNGELGEGLYNQSQLDLDNDGVAEEIDEACGDLPNVYHEKEVVSFVPMANGNHMVTYEICVYNNGGADGEYDLYDEPQFDDDIEIIGATYSCDVGGAGAALATPVPAGGWLLLDDQDISPGISHCCTVDIEVDIDTAPGSGGDNTLSECGEANAGNPSPGEALYNESSLDLNNDGTPDEMDEACEDVFMLSHEKTISSINQTGHNQWCITYNIAVENSGMEAGFYDLSDLPQFDDDITITSASYSSTIHPSTTLSTTPPAGGWILGDDEAIASNTTHIYTLEVCVEIDLEDGVVGDDSYTACGAGGGTDGAPGEGLYNQSQLDTNNDGTPDETDEVCADIPYLTLEKVALVIGQTGPRDYDVTYQLTVCNVGGSEGQYNLMDQPCFDDDVVINSARYSTDAMSNNGNPGPLNLAGAGPWTMASDQSIDQDDCQIYTLVVNVTLDLTDPLTPGDGMYIDCQNVDTTDPTARGGTYNKSTLDTDDDGQSDIQDEACMDLPHVTHEKELTSNTQTGANNWEVKYTITVTNDGNQESTYGLIDTPSFDDDVVITCANYTSIAHNNVGNPGPFTLPNSGPWTLATNQFIDSGEVDIYCLTVCVEMDLNSPATPGDGTYTECGAGGAGVDGQPGEGLYNKSSLDLDNDGTADEEDEACGDLPHLYHEKSVSSFAPMANGNHMVVYEICVTNDGGADGMYDLYDYPQFDDDITIIAAESTCDVGGVSVLAIPPVRPNGWQLENDVTIPAGETFCCTLDIEVNIDIAPGSGGDNVVTECGTATPGDPSPGEALYNESSLDTNNDGTPDEMDEACEDVFNIDHEKELLSVVQQADGSWCATYEIVVTNRGNEDGFYDLYDLPQYDSDFTILSAVYSSTVHPNTNLSVPVPTGLGWQIANDIALASGVSHTYNLVVCADLDLENGVADGGDDVYTACGAGGAGSDGQPGEGLHNLSSIDTNDDGTPDQQDEACGDVPYFTLDKELVGQTQIGPRSWTLEYNLDVCNIGGATGTYDVLDTPCFDDDVVIDGARYSTNAPSNAGNPGPSTLTNAGPWLIGDDESLGEGSCHEYTLYVDVTMDLSDPSTPGDESYTACGDGGVGAGTTGEGLHNKASLDTNNDGTIDAEDSTCGNLPSISHEKELTSITQTGPTNWELKYTITVANDGGLAGLYDLTDDPSYDDDVVVTCASFTSDATGNPGDPDLGIIDPWVLADNQSIDPDVEQVYCLIVCVDMDLDDPNTPGDGDYDECGAGGGVGNGQSSEGLSNISTIDLNDDGVSDEGDEACGDLPHIYHEKKAQGFAPMANGNHMVTYEICVYNDGGADGTYDLYDYPQFDDDIEIIEMNYSCDNNINGSETPPVPVGGWLIVDDEMISPGEDHCCTVKIEVHIDTAPGSGGDDIVTECGTAIPGDPSPGEALYNESGLDLDNDGTVDEMDEACEDVFMIQHVKTIADLQQTGHNEWCITYNVVVNNNGMEPGFYDLYDFPQFDDDIVINSARYSSTVHAVTQLTPLNPTAFTDWQFADDVFIGAMGTHVYTLDLCFTIDLDDGGTVDSGDDLYNACGDGGAGSDGQPGEGLFNQTFLDTNDDGTPDETDEVCADIPYFKLEKTFIDVVDTGAFIWDVTYEVEVCNVGGAAWEYSLDDTPCFDTDIIIQDAEVSSNAPGNASNPGPQTLFGTGPWILATDQNALPDACHTYTIVAGVWMNLNDPTTPGDGEFSYCADVNTADPNAKGGLYNKTSLDDTDDGDADIDASDCGELPYCEELEGTVFYDLNNNGCQDPFETAVTEDIEVTLYECGENGNPDVAIATTTTINGDYNFGTGSPNENADVCPSPFLTYRVEFNLPNGTGESLDNWEFSSHDTETCAPGTYEDSVDPATGSTDCYDPENDDPTDGDEDEHLDAGIYPCQELSGVIFYDLDNDGCQEAGEMNVTEAVTVNLYECDAAGNASGAPVASATTQNGEYEFGPDSTTPGGEYCLDPSIDYIVEFVIDNTIGSGNLEGWEFTSNDTEVCADLADTDDINPATGQSSCYDPNDDDEWDNDPSNDDEDENIDAGIYPCQDISGEIFWDIHNNGCEDQGDMLVTEDVTVAIFECDASGAPVGPAVASTTVNDGLYEFAYDSQDPGAQVCLDPSRNYIVQFSFDDSDGAPLEGQDFSTGEDVCADDTESDDIDPDTGLSACYDPEDDDPADGDDDNDVDAGINPCEEISGEVFIDINNNGCQDNGEVLATDPINVSVFECNQDPAVDAPVASTQTIDGEYEFGPNSVNANAQVCLDPTKEYFVVFEIPQAAGDPYEYYQFSSHDTETCANGEDSDDIDPTNGQSACYDPENGDADSDDDGDEDNHIDAGIFPCQNLAGEIFYDNENNGCEDNSDTPVAEDVTVNLYECDAAGNPSGPSVASTTTIGGQYEFGLESPNVGADVCLDPSKQYFVEFVIDNSIGGNLEGWEFSLGTETCATEDESDDLDPSTGQSGCFDPNEDDGWDNDPSNDDGDGHIDGGIYPCQDMSGEIFWDINDNGCQDNGEVLVTEDVTVEIFECDASGQPAGPALASTTVNDGLYDFSYNSEDAGAAVCLDPSKTYQVQFSFDSSVGAPLEGQDFSTGEEVCADTMDADDIDPNSGSSGCYDPNDDDPSDGDDDNDVDAGINPCESLRGEVFYDLDNNGCQDNNEDLVLDPVNVNLYECNAGVNTGGTLIASTSTQSGAYEFGPNSKNPGADVCLDPTKEYYVEFVIPQAPGDPLEFYSFSTTDAMGSCAAADAGDDIDPNTGTSGCYDPEDTDGVDGNDDEHIDAGIFPCQKIAGEIFLDMDNSGCEDSDEVLVEEDVTVTLFECDGSGSPLGTALTATTVNDGEYEFGPQSDDVGGEICLEPNKTYMVVFSFDNSPGAPLEGNNFSSNEGACGTSDESDDIDPDTGMSECYDPEDGTGDIGNDPDSDQHIDAGINPCQEMGGTVFYDFNGNGCQDNGEGPVAEDVTVTIYECNAAGNPVGGTPLASMTTVNGEYLFSEDSPYDGAQVCLISGRQYYVDFDFDNSPGAPLNNYVFTNGNDVCANTADSDDVNDTTGTSGCYDPDDTDADGGDSDNHVDAGIMPLAKLGNSVWLDCNGNGIHDGNEGGVAGIRVEVYDIDGNLVKMTMTDSNGNFLITHLYPGQYYVKYLIGDYEFTAFSVGGNSTSDSDVSDSNGSGTTDLTTLSPGECNFDDFDAGIYECVRIGEIVWLDYNENDVWDPNENGINGLKVELYKFRDGSWSLFDYTYTGHKPGTPSDDGFFKFCVAPGRYYLKFLNPPATLVPAVQNFGINENIDSDVTGFFGPGTTNEISIMCGEERCDIGAGYYKMGSIGDNVWMDSNGNGMRENTEVGLSNVIVRAYDLTGSKLAETTTDANGEYMLDYLGKNTYYLKFDLPPNMTVTQANMGADDSMDSDVDGSNGPMTTPYYNVLPGTHTANVDAGVIYSVLAIEWERVWAENMDTYHNVNWELVSEQNVSHYEIERSIGTLDDFELVGKMLSQGDTQENRQYHYDDYDVEETGIYYYRIKEVDLAGNFNYSKWVSVDREDVVGLGINSLRVYPNPVVDELTIDINVVKDLSDLSVNIFDAQGRLVRSNIVMDIDVTRGNKKYKVGIQDLAKGVYSLKVKMDSREIVKKIIVIDQ